MEWRPHPGQQTKALQTNADEVLYGGARGGGKTEAGIGWLIGWDENGIPLYKHPKYRALVIRRNADDLSDWISRAKYRFNSTGATFAYRPTDIRFPSGAMIKTGHLKDADAYTKYQGHEYPRILVEEITQIPDEDRYIKLKGSNRSTIPEIPPQMFLTTNPDGVGHGWVKRRFVDPVAPNTKFKDDDGLTRIFIPAKLEDNPTLLKGDPNYVRYLEGIRRHNPDLYRAWRHGDWDTFVGQYFGEFRREKHVIRRFSPDYSDGNLTFISGMDWGRAKPFAFLATVVVEQVHEGNKFYRAVTFQEIYGTGKTPQEWASQIKTTVPIHLFKSVRADPSIFKETEDGSIPIAKQFENYGVKKILPADNNRVSGWESLHRWLSIAPDGMPYWLITENCVNLIRTLPELVHDDVRVEDLDTLGEDHACFCKHTPILTQRGTIPIINIRRGDKVWTPLGWSKVRRLIPQGRRRLNSFRSIKATGNHPFLTQDGFRPLRDLRSTDMLWNVSTSSGNRSGDIQLRQDFPIRSILGVLQRRREKAHSDSITRYGSSSTGLFQRAATFIIKNTITIETILRIWRFTLKPIILNYFGKRIENTCLRLLEKISKLLGHMPLSGTVVRKASSFIATWERCRGNAGEKKLGFATDARRDIGLGLGIIPNTVASTARCTCSDVDEAWDIETDTGMFTAQDVIVSNSDAARYHLVHLKWIDPLVGGVKTRDSFPTRKKKTMPDPTRPLDLEKFGSRVRAPRDWRAV